MRNFDIDDMDNHARHRVRFILSRITWAQIEAIRNVGGNHPGSLQVNADLRWMETMADRAWAESDEAIAAVVDGVALALKGGV